MIFRPELVRQIRAGRKTTTRRLTNGAPTCRYLPGKTYAVQPGRCQAATCRIYITSVHAAAAGDLDLTAAVQEGFRTTDEFKTYWVSLHDKKWLERENTMLDEAENDDGVTLHRDTWITRRSVTKFDQDHAQQPVWVISFHLDTTEQPRLLALRSDEIYTSNPARALPDEPEAVDRDTQRRITANADMTTSQWQTLEHAQRDRDRALLSREDQINRLHRAARLRGNTGTIRDELRLLETMRNTATDDAFARKVSKTERRVFGVAA